MCPDDRRVEAVVPAAPPAGATAPAITRRLTPAARPAGPWLSTRNTPVGRNPGVQASGLAANPFAIEHHQMVGDAFPQAAIRKADEPAVGGLMEREVGGQHTPRHTAT